MDELMVRCTEVPNVTPLKRDSSVHSGGQMDGRTGGTVYGSPKCYSAEKRFQRAFLNGGQMDGRTDGTVYGSPKCYSA